MMLGDSIAWHPAPGGAPALGSGLARWYVVVWLTDEGGGKQSAQRRCAQYPYASSAASGLWLLQ